MDDRALLVQIDAAMSRAVAASGPWIACRAGCAECCLGPFEITELDARRLRAGLAAAEPERAAAILARAASHVEGDDQPCPVLDPQTLTCDLYEARPVTCRVFGPATQAAAGDAVGACELCYEGASDVEIAACAVVPDPEDVEGRLLGELGDPPLTTVAQALYRPSR